MIRSLFARRAVGYGIVAAAGFAIGSAGVALAVVSGVIGGAGVINGCYNTTNGDLRVVDSPSECRKHERSLSWVGTSHPGLIDAFSDLEGLPCTGPSGPSTIAISVASTGVVTMTCGTAQPPVCTPTSEACGDNIDNDCDGQVDEGCGSGGYACTPTGAEVCDGRDNDCDQQTDEGTGGQACGTGVGACSAGVTVCTINGLVCVGAVVPTVEICNNIDDDCDGTVDEECTP